ncbi:MAG TPA: sigma-70 family RNA polymerase sigma factor [Sphingobium sp.]|uniref:RNA polymerase sigma factor n=1 Tax=Sphingobium sp. TaxID=1912891 RepID=UPI002ED52D23
MMGETTRSLLMRLLLSRYASLRSRLASRLGPELADDALQETWIRLETRDTLAPVRNPDAYLFRAALNAASNLRKGEQRRLSHLEIETLLNVADDTPGPSTIAEDRASITVVQQVLSELSDRQRIIFEEAFLGDASHQMLAERFGISLRMIQKELKYGVDLCARRLKRGKSFASDRVQLSDNGRRDA